MTVALRKESVDRNVNSHSSTRRKVIVALRKESVDRNSTYVIRLPRCQVVALRKESVDRNVNLRVVDGSKSSSLSARRAWIEIPPLCGRIPASMSLSARRAWIEMLKTGLMLVLSLVALRKESVDRNAVGSWPHGMNLSSLSARRAWIEIQTEHQ